MPDDLDTTVTDDTTTAGGITGDGGAVDDDTAGGDTGDGSTSTAKPVAKPSKPAQDGKDRTPVIDGEYDVERAKRTIARQRAEAETLKAAKAAAEKDRADTLKAVAKALGLAEEDKPDPDALTRQLEEARAAERQRRTELQVLRIAPGLDADADALLDSQAFAKAIADLDPSAGSFRDDVEDAIRDTLTKHPRYKLPTVTTTDGSDSGDTKTTAKTASKRDAGKSGTDMASGSGKPRQITASELEKMTPEQIVKAQNDGLLDDLLGR